MRRHRRLVKTLDVTLSRQHDYAFVRGENAYDLIVAAGGRPMWNPTRKAWHTSAKKASGMLAIADLRGYVVSYTEEKT